MRAFHRKSKATPLAFSPLFATVIIFGLAACSKSQSPPPVLQVTGFESYVQQFEQESTTQNASLKVGNLIIQFGPMTTSAERGVCEVSSDTTPTITLDQNYWENVDEDSRESLIFHEMGHCVRNRLHVTDLQEGGDPSSLMYPYTIDGPTYLRNEDLYWPELFANGPYFSVNGS